MTSAISGHSRIQGSPRIPGPGLPDFSEVVLRGKRIGVAELTIIRACLEAYGPQGRTSVSERVCERLGWKQPNGWLQDRACRDILRALEGRGLLTLPPMKPQYFPRNGGSARQRVDRLKSYDFDSAVSCAVSDPEWHLAKGTIAESLWNQFVARYHYLGYEQTVGRSLKYLAFSSDRLIAAISFTSPSWRLWEREKILSLLKMDSASAHDIVLNNARFLIAPNVRIPHLASSLLAAATRKVSADWEAFYSIRPEILETFIQPSRFHGTTYKAANWVLVGTTRGYAKSGAEHQRGVEPKHLYLYGLTTSVHRRLREIMKLHDPRR